MKPLFYTPDVETISPDENSIHDEMNAAFRHIQETTHKNYGHAVRAVHAKSHGIMVGELDIYSNLPPEFAQGLCETPGTHPAILRFSTNAGDILDDSVSLPRGLAVKVLNVAGDRLPGAEGHTQDFVMANAQAFTAKDAKAFLGSLKMLAKTTDTPQIFKKALSGIMRGVEHTLELVGTKSSTVISLGGHPETHILGETFYSQAPMRWGDYIAKVSVAPISPELTALTNQPLNVNGKPDGLRDAVHSFFRENGGEWELRVQLCTNAKTMPVEDASVVWPEEESPYIAVGRLRVAAQPTWTDEKKARFDDGLSFSPWHGLAAHQPLGSIMRARRATYPPSATFRGQHTGCPLHEPHRV